MLSKPILAKCSDRSVRAKTNPICGEPENWFDYDMLSRNSIGVLSFDFFVNWSNLSIPDEIWIKRIIDNQASDLSQKDYVQFYNWIDKVDGKPYMDKLLTFCDKNNISCHYFLFKDNESWKDDPNTIYDICITNPSVNVLSPSGVQSRIKELRNVSVPIGPGGLIYGTSSLEGYLSKTPYFWPGDVDALLIDKNNSVRAIIEYKKHNLNTAIEQQTLMNYRDRDRQKYQSLGLLRDRLQSDDTSLPILMVYYPTNPNIEQIKVERIDGDYDNLSVIKSEVWEIPKAGEKRSQRRYIESLINFIK